MNARALLKSQGWRGEGHSLHATDDSNGLAKPILVSRKDNKLGIGKKEHATADQWWLNAFDQQLKGLDTSKQGTVVQTLTNGRLNAIVGGTGKYRGVAGLYASFVSGGMLEGTIESPASTSTDATPDRESASPPAGEETREERKARRAAKKDRKAERAARRAAKNGATALEETKEQRQARRAAQKQRKAEKALRRNTAG